MLRRLLFAGLTTLLACQAAPLRADAPTTPDALLALPPSPGVEVLLLPHAAEPRVQQRWREALADQSADRRAAAARMIWIAGLRGAIGGLISTLPTEQDAVARAELLRALLVVGSEVTDRMVLQRLDQLAPATARRAVRIIATLRPAGAAKFILDGGVLGETRGLASERGGDLFARLLRVSPTDAARLEAEPERLAASTLQGILHMAHVSARPVPVPMLMAGLRTDAETAGEVLCYLPAIHGRPGDADEALSKAYASWREQQASTGDPTHDLLLAMADRWLGRTAPAPLGLDQVDATALTRLQLPTASYAVLSRDERRALVRRLNWKGDAAEALEDAGFVVRAPTSDWEDGTPAALLITDLPAAVLADLVQLTGCKGKAFPGDLAMTTKYRLDGRPLSIQLGGAELDASCDRLVQLIAGASYGEPTLAGEGPRQALLRVIPDFVSCQSVRDAELRQPRPTLPTGQPITAPRKVKDRKPAYPLAAQRAGIQGVVVVEASLTRTGCVAEARVLRSIPALDLAALQAVASWRYTPLLLGDVPVSTLMTVSVSFSLDR